MCLRRTQIAFANVIVYSYYYLLDPKVAELVSRELSKECIVVFDEAHNIGTCMSRLSLTSVTAPASCQRRSPCPPSAPRHVACLPADNVCIESMSIDITRPVLQAGSRSLEMLSQKIEEYALACPPRFCSSLCRTSPLTRCVVSAAPCGGRARSRRIKTTDAAKLRDEYNRLVDGPCCVRPRAGSSSCGTHWQRWLQEHGEAVGEGRPSHGRVEPRHGRDHGQPRYPTGRPAVLKPAIGDLGSRAAGPHGVAASGPPVAVLPDEILQEAIPGTIRRAEHFIAFLRRFVEYLKVAYTARGLENEWTCGSESLRRRSRLACGASVGVVCGRQTRLRSQHVVSESPLSFLQDLKEITQIERKPLT